MAPPVASATADLGVVFDGLDLVANLAPLCSWCHRGQPIFRPGDEYEARTWFALPGPEARP